MKLNPNRNLTQPQIFEHYTHPWYEHNERLDKNKLIRPNPPSKEAIEKAKFVDKTYHWSGDNSVRSGNKRSSK